MIRIHREGTLIITVSFLIAAMALFTGSYFLPGWLFIILLVAISIIMTLMVRFFRIPKRKFVTDKNAIIAPADGTVVAIEKVYEEEYFKEERLLISIFMSIHNVHINWYPISGELKYFKYHPGKYLLARHPKSSSLNERTSIVIGNGRMEILVRQIAGYVARRIISYASGKKQVQQSEEMGFIRFGSRLDVYLPLNSKISVSLGDKTVGGASVIARLD